MYHRCFSDYLKQSICKLLLLAFLALVWINVLMSFRLQETQEVNISDALDSISAVDKQFKLAKTTYVALLHLHLRHERDETCVHSCNMFFVRDQDRGWSSNYSLVLHMDSCVIIDTSSISNTKTWCQHKSAHI